MSEDDPNSDSGNNNSEDENIIKRLFELFRRNLSPEQTQADDFVKSIIDIRKRSLKAIKQRADLEGDGDLVREEAEAYLDIAGNLLEKKNYIQAYNYTLIAERRILILLLENKKEFSRLIKVKRVDYISDANRLKQDELLEEEEIKKVDEISGKAKLNQTDWFTLGELIMRARMNIVAPTILQATATDRIMTNIALFSILTSSLLLFLLVSTLIGLISLFPTNVEIQVADTTIQFLDDLPLVTRASSLQFVTLLSTIIFGVIGSLVFGLFTHRKILAEKKPPLDIMSRWFDISRLVLGAISAPLVVISLYSGIFQIDQVLTSSGILLISFLSGYSEVLLIKSIEQSLPRDGDKGLEQSRATGSEMTGQQNE